MDKHIVNIYFDICCVVSVSFILHRCGIGTLDIEFLPLWRFMVLGECLGLCWSQTPILGSSIDRYSRGKVSIVTSPMVNLSYSLMSAFSRVPLGQVVAMVPYKWYLNQCQFFIGNIWYELEEAKIEICKLWYSPWRQ